MWRLKTHAAAACDHCGSVDLQPFVQRASSRLVSQQPVQCVLMTGCVFPVPVLEMLWTTSFCCSAHEETHVDDARYCGGFDGGERRKYQHPDWWWLRSLGWRWG